MTAADLTLGNYKRFGIMGGSFNPVHLGHISIAQQILDGMKLENICLMPAASPPHKQHDSEMAPPRDRLEMCRMAVQGLRGLSVSDFEIQRGGISYTIETARALRGIYGADAEIRFLIGSDSLAELSAWREIKTLVEMVDFAIANRRTCPIEEPVWVAVKESLGAEAERKLRSSVVQIMPVDISSTQIRQRVREGKDLNKFVRHPVAAYIETRRLYRQPNPPSDPSSSRRSH